MTRSLFVVAVVALTACPPPVPTPDGGDDGGGINPNPMDACSGGCAVNQICDTANRVCKDGCAGACDGGTICQRTAPMASTFQCAPIVTTCGATMCGEGQVACLAGVCSCLGPARGAFDSCYGDDRFPGGGSVCQEDGTCGAPTRYHDCKSDGTPCANGLKCVGICAKGCMQSSECFRGEYCDTQYQVCLPNGFRYNCEIQIDAGVVDDAGMHVLSFQTVTVGSKCLVEVGNVPTDPPDMPSGTCTYAFFYPANGDPSAFGSCRPPGDVPENGLCKSDQAITARATQCSTALECALMRGGQNGICLRTCNALPPSVTYPSPQPSCPMTESCVNLYRREDVGHDGALLGVCAKKCDIFDATQSQCPNYGTIPAVCVPTNADGRVVVSSDGSGICLPRRETIAALDAPCDETDPFKGAACGTGQVCPPAGVNVAPICTQVCDTGCSPRDGGSMAPRCATEVNALCPQGKTCRTVTTTTGARMGFCQ